MNTYNFSYLTALSSASGPTGASSNMFGSTISDTGDGMIDGSTAIGAYITVGTESDYTLRATTENGIVLEDSAGRFYLFSTVSYGANNALINLNTTDPYTYCFMAGTMITTPDADVPVESLKIGDRVVTQDGRTVLVKWIGEQRIKNWMFTSAERAPVCISAGALGDCVPHTDLYVSADHGMIVDGLVINASALVNHDTIRFVPMAELPESFTYYHIETEAHDAILANGAAAETFIDYTGRQNFDNHQEYLDLYGAERIIPEMPHSRISTRRLVPEEIKARLDKKLDWDAMLESPDMVVSVARGTA